MAKLMVTIDIPDMSYEELSNEMVTDNDKWFPHGSFLVRVDSKYIKKDPEKEGFFLFDWIGIRP